MFGGAEIYTKDNRYGRYQSYGSVQIMGKGNPVSRTGSGFVQDVGIGTACRVRLLFICPSSCWIVR